MVGAEKRSLLLLLGSSALADPGCFADFTVESAGLGRPSLQFAVQRPALYLVHSTLSPQCTVTIKNKNGHTLISIFKLEQSLRTEKLNYCEEDSEKILCFAANNMFKYSL